MPDASVITEMEAVAVVLETGGESCWEEFRGERSVSQTRLPVPV